MRILSRENSLLFFISLYPQWSWSFSSTSLLKLPELTELLYVCFSYSQFQNAQVYYSVYYSSSTGFYSWFLSLFFSEILSLVFSDLTFLTVEKSGRGLVLFNFCPNVLQILFVKRDQPRNFVRQLLTYPFSLLPESIEWFFQVQNWRIPRIKCKN